VNCRQTASILAPTNAVWSTPTKFPKHYLELILGQLITQLDIKLKNKNDKLRDRNRNDYFDLASKCEESGAGGGE
jgi:hypothetical protein